ncbi:S-adenosyl-L-methionine-dependent methyltransferase [Staphylotrichum tortipilum]|uniref:Leucine carboxyl methyltransferase 1 n=1 Tax=Staphylotrichum tortipilum TaxID=2831512 RepID=A0AAN6MJV7_9PEZI|nr:S-adenosyl-L-methionine-dependent methyltransferase [Staphylotrichum longicolle]
MSAPSIPNLLSLRSGAASGRGRGTGPGGPARRGPPGSRPGPTHDATIQATDTDAAVSRLSAVDLGYLDDPFARLFVQGPATRRLPIINRGTYTRTTAIDALVDRFLATTDPDRPRQIVSLGAGTDTRCMRLLTSPHRNHRNLAYHEIDFPAIMARKQALIATTPSLRAILAPPVPLSPTAWHAPSLDPAHGNSLNLHGLDLRTLTPSSPPLPNLDLTAPTLLLSECCLCYLPLPSSSPAPPAPTPLSSTSPPRPPLPPTPPPPSPILSHFTTHLPSPTPLSLIIYEPILPHDPFGRTMTTNLAARGIVMPTLSIYPTAAAQEARVRAAGFAEARVRTVDEIWEGWVDAKERERADGLEGLDEIEEWRLLAGHYVVVWGWRKIQGGFGCGRGRGMEWRRRWGDGM